MQFLPGKSPAFSKSGCAANRLRTYSSFPSSVRARVKDDNQLGRKRMSSSQMRVASSSPNCNALILLSVQLDLRVGQVGTSQGTICIDGCAAYSRTCDSSSDPT